MFEHTSVGMALQQTSDSFRMSGLLDEELSVRDLVRDAIIDTGRTGFTMNAQITQYNHVMEVWTLLCSEVRIGSVLLHDVKFVMYPESMCKDPDDRTDLYDAIGSCVAKKQQGHLLTAAFVKSLRQNLSESGTPVVVACYSPQQVSSAPPRNLFYALTQSAAAARVEQASGSSHRDHAGRRRVRRTR